MKRYLIFDIFKGHDFASIGRVDLVIYIEDFYNNQQAKAFQDSFQRFREYDIPINFQLFIYLCLVWALAGLLAT